MDGTKKLSSNGISSETIILADANTENHKAGSNAIRLDGSFRQGGNTASLLLAQAEKEELPGQLLMAVKDADLDEVKRLLAGRVLMSTQKMLMIRIRHHCIMLQFMPCMGTAAIFVKELLNHPDIDVHTKGNSSSSPRRL